MSAFRDLTGQRFGRLVAIKYNIRPSGKSCQPKTFWICQCDCGNVKEVSSTNLLTGNTSSCGCYASEYSKKINTKHGLSKTRFYNIWSSMISRVKNKNHKYHDNYGGRGINIDSNWSKFENFMNDMYDSYLKHVIIYGELNTTIDRIDNEGNYSLNNCKWSTRFEQSMNTRRNKKYLICGEMLTIKEISEKYNLKYSIVIDRIRRNWPPERVIIPPTRRLTRRLAIQ